MQTPTVAALYIAKNSVYKSLGADCYDIDRDARTYTGDLPVVAHPVCAPWGKLKGFCKMPPSAKDCAWDALAQVRRVGGILEHPVGSTFFREAGIDVPSVNGTCGRPDKFGGYVLRLAQWDMGHRGDKATLFYIFGTEILPVLFERHGGEKRPVQNMSQRERLATPIPMAVWMIRVAELCKPAQAFRELLRAHQVDGWNEAPSTVGELMRACFVARRVDAGEPVSATEADAAEILLNRWSPVALMALAQDRPVLSAEALECRELI